MIRNLAIALVAFSAALAAPATATTITNTPAWNGVDYIFPFGSPDTTNYGQSFVSPGGSLTSVTFNSVSGNAGNVKLVIATWDGYSLTSAPLYESSEISHVAPGAISFTLDFDTTAGTTYIAFLSVAGVSSPVSGVNVGATYYDSIADGSFYFLNTGGAAPIVGQGWGTFGSGYDLAFSATFTEGVPEPATWAMLITGFGLVGATARRRRPATA